MPDREKVIDHLNNCVKASRRDSKWLLVSKDIVDDAISMLKEQEPAKPIRINTNFEQSWKCGECGGLVNTHFKYCPYCGRSLRWGNEIPGI